MDSLFQSNEVDPFILEDDAVMESFDFVTPKYKIQVAIREDVGGIPIDILDLLDRRTERFLDCQFNNSNIGFDEFMIIEGQTIGPLSDLRVFVIPNKFECMAINSTVCSGVYYFGSDLIIVAREKFANCDEFPVWKHELGHKYGMKGDHSNQSDFEPCIDPPGCSFIDIIDIGIGG